MSLLDLIDELNLKTALFPFPLRFFEGRAFFDCEFKGITFGSELTELNGKSLADALAELGNFDVDQQIDQR